MSRWLRPPAGKCGKHFVGGRNSGQSSCHQHAIIHMQRDGVEGDARQVSANASRPDHDPVAPEHYLATAHQPRRVHLIIPPRPKPPSKFSSGTGCCSNEPLEICNLLDDQELFPLSCSWSFVLRSNRPGCMKNKTNNAATLASTVAIALSTMAAAVSSFPAAAKKPGATYCINGICHRVKTVDEVNAEIGLEVTQGASFYDQCEVDVGNPCTPMSSRELC